MFIKNPDGTVEKRIVLSDDDLVTRRDAIVSRIANIKASRDFLKQQMDDLDTEQAQREQDASDLSKWITEKALDGPEDVG